jgi:hypothetical protein
MTTELVVAVNPDTGEVLEHLEQQPPEALAEAFEAVRRYESEVKRWHNALEAELRRRMKIVGRELAVFGDWEVEAKFDNRREWDPDELEAVLEDLQEQGRIRAQEGAGVIQRTATVSGTAALALRSRLERDAQAMIDTTYTWTRKRRPLRVVRSVSLEGATAGALSDISDTRMGAPALPASRPAESPQAPITDLEELFK